MFRHRTVRGEFWRRDRLHPVGLCRGWYAGRRAVHRRVRGGLPAPVYLYKVYLLTYLFIHCLHKQTVLWHCWLGVRKSKRSVKTEWLGAGVWLSVWSKVQIVCIWSSGCHCHAKTSSRQVRCWSLTSLSITQMISDNQNLIDHLLPLLNAEFPVPAYPGL